MVDADRQQLVAALILLVSALFVAVNVVKPRYRAIARRISTAAFLVALCLVLFWVVVWLAAQL